VNGGIARGFVLAGAGAFLLYAFFSGALSGTVALIAAAVRSAPTGAGGSSSTSTPSTFTQAREGGK